MSDLPARAGARSARFTVESIARLSSGQIGTLADEELIALIRAVPYPFAGKERLEFFDRDTLERVSHLVRRWCLNKLALRSAEAVGRTVPDSAAPAVASEPIPPAAEHAGCAAVSAAR